MLQTRIRVAPALMTVTNPPVGRAAFTHLVRSTGAIARTTLKGMQLHLARLCLNCGEIHDQQTCPLCMSESFAFISRWVPAPERRAQPRPLPSRDTADIYRQLLDAKSEESGARRWIKRGVLGLGVAAIAGWAWRGQSAASRESPSPGTPPDELP